MARLFALDCSTNDTLSTILRDSFLLSKDIVIACNDADKVECDQANNDSGCESDWRSSTCIHPGEYNACNESDTKMKLSVATTSV
eukprot:319984-Ditylum_brightwellii.AAC.1